MRPYVKTYSVCIGNATCNAKCPFCVAKMTASLGSRNTQFVLNERNLRKGAQLARDYGATTALITGKGEPALWPDHLIQAAKILSGYFPLVEVQTNGMRLSDYLTINLYLAGVTTIAVSCVHWDDRINAECYGGRYSLGDTVNAIHLKEMAVRLTCMCVKGWVDDPEKVDRFVHVANGMGVEQLTFRSIKVGSATWRAPEVHKWTTAEHAVDMTEIQKFIEDGRATRLESLVHGNVYAYYTGIEVLDAARGRLREGNEQNVCLSDCLTRNPEGNTIRQLILCPDGHVRYDWEHDAAIVF